MTTIPVDEASPQQQPKEESSLSLDALQQRLEQIHQRRKKVCEQKHRLEQVQSALEERLNQSELDQEQALLDLRSVVYQKRRAAGLFQLSQQWNVLSDCFQISHRGPFGTINGLRLGAEALSLDLTASANGSNETVAPSTTFRRPFLMGGSTESSSAATTTIPHSPTSATSIRVPWIEVNAALGHVALLLSTLASRPHAGIVLRHTILPMGSTSKIGIKRGESSISLYNLYSDDSFQFFGKRNFNFALQCLLECVQDAVEAIQNRDRTIAVPHAIEKERDTLSIGGLSVAYGTDGVEWTRAMKYLLTDLKHLLTFRALVLWDS